MCANAGESFIKVDRHITGHVDMRGVIHVTAKLQSTILQVIDMTQRYRKRVP